MAKFRRSHDRQGSNSSRIILVGVVAVIILFGIGMALKNLRSLAESPKRFESERNFLPYGGDYDVVDHTYYSLAYSEEKEGAAWVAYELFGETVAGPWVARTNDFRPDPMVKSGSAEKNDFKRSGYDRGHLVPAADMAFDEKAMSETFYMSNISPQERAFNHGVWRELEELTRDWAKKNDRLVVVSGPIWEDDQPVVGRKNKMVVPDAYFKVLLDIDLPKQSAIGFVIPNALQRDKLDRFAMPVDSVERITGLDFYRDYVEPALQEDLEATVDPDHWPLNEKKYRIRLERWNKE